ncbi:hypothetical protein D3C78_1112830 [compost metagenome]
MRLGSERILLFTADAVLLHQVLGRNAHVVVVEGIPQAVGDHAVDQLAVAHALPGSRRRHHVGGQAHVLLASGDHHLGITATDGLGRQVQGLEARTADFVQGQRRHTVGQAGLDRGLAGRVLPGAGGEYLAENHLIDLCRVQPGLLQQALDHGSAQVYRRHVGQGTLEAADGGAGCGDDDHIVHLVVLRVQVGAQRAQCHQLRRVWLIC